MILTNAHVPKADDSDGINDSLYEKMKHTFSGLSTCHINISLGNFNAFKNRV